jgi:2-phosphosulfolactate phosphatase
MRVHVALSPSEFADAPVSGRTVLAVDVLRATSAAVAACEAGCRRVVPVPDEAAAEALRDGAGVVLAGERGGNPIPGFDLGNSPDEFTRARVEGRTVVLTTTNGTAAMMRAATGATAGLAALTNVTAAAGWARDQGRDVTILCAGDNGAFSLEDAVCAGLLVARLTDGVPAAELSVGAEAARALGLHYAGRLPRLAADSPWARRLAHQAREVDLAACLRQDVSAMVPVFIAGGFAVTRPERAGLAAGAPARDRAGSGA